MNKASDKPLSEQDRQRTPVEGEVAMKDARIKAATFASQEKMLLKKSKHK